MVDRSFPVLWLFMPMALAGCGESESAPYAPLGGEGEVRTCASVAPPERRFFEGGLMAQSTYWDCLRPRAGEGPLDVEVSGTEAVVTGGSAELAITWAGGQDIVDRNLLYWIEAPANAPPIDLLARSGSSRRGYYAWIPSENANPLELALRVSPDAIGGNYTISFTMDNGTADPTEPRNGNVVRHSIHVIPVGTGDIQVNLNWRVLADLDLHVTDPSGELIAFFNKQSASGGDLDLDSYPACAFENDRGRGNENVYWGEDEAPSGEFIIEVDLWSECDAFVDNQTIDYRVVVIIDGEATAYEGAFMPGGATLHEATRVEYEADE